MAYEPPVPTLTFIASIIAIITAVVTHWKCRVQIQEILTMYPTARPRVKICCISSIEEAQLAIRYGASALGLVSAMPSGPGVIEEAQIACIAATIPPTVASFLLTSQQDADAVIEQQRRCRVNTLQLVDSFPFDGYKKLREALPGIALVQVVHVTGEASLEEAVMIAPHVQAILLDSSTASRIFLLISQLWMRPGPPNAFTLIAGVPHAQLGDQQEDPGGGRCAALSSRWSEHGERG